MGSGEVGGDGSVQWDIHGNSITSHSDSSSNPKHVQHKAKDDTDPSDRYFHVTIKLPQDGDQRGEFLTSLERGWRSGQAGQDVTFDLRIEDEDNRGPIKDQIKITWKSLGDSGPGQAREARCATKICVPTRIQEGVQENVQSTEKSKRPVTC